MPITSQARHRRPTARMLAASAAALATALAVSSAPLAQASLTDDNFLSALNAAGINVGDPGGAVSLGQSLCPMIENAGQPLSSVVSTVLPSLGGLSGLGGGISPGMAGMFTSIALSMYCPQVVNSVTSGNLSGLPQIPGVPGVSDLSSLAGIPGLSGL